MKTTKSKIAKMITFAFLMITAGSFAINAQHLANYGEQALWVWPRVLGTNPVCDPTARQELINRSSASGVDILYVDVYQSTASHLYDPSAISDLIIQANANNIEVWAVYGEQHWADDFGCDPNGWARQRMQDIINYNSNNPTAAFDGIMLDVEVHNVANSLTNLLTMYECILTEDLQPNNMGLSIAARFYWDAIIEYPTGSGVFKEAYKHIIDLPLDNMVVMGYRDCAGGTGNSCEYGGTIELDQEEIYYADSIGKNGMVLVGIETQAYDPTYNTFFEEGQYELNNQADLIAQHFATSTGFGGFAVHHYGEAYLGDTELWPAVNMGNATPWLANGDDLLNNNTGYVGIGTTTPVHILDIAGTLRADGVHLPNGTMQGTTDIAFELQPNFANKRVMEFHAAPNQAASLVQVFDSNSSLLFNISDSGFATHNGITQVRVVAENTLPVLETGDPDIEVNDPNYSFEGDASVVIRSQNNAHNRMPLRVTGVDGQTANLQEWQQDDYTALSVIDEAGRLGIATSDPLAIVSIGGAAGVDGIMFPDGTIQTTAATMAMQSSTIGNLEDRMNDLQATLASQKEVLQQLRELKQRIVSEMLLAGIDIDDSVETAQQ